MPSRLKKWIESHPAAVLAGVVVSVGSTASSVTAYLSREVYNAENAQAQGQFIAEKSELQNKYNVQINDLTSRLSSIERRVGNSQEKEYFDVQSLQISSPEVKNLPSEYKNYDGGSFFIKVPISDTWKYMNTTEGAVLKLGPFRSAIEQIESVAGDDAKNLLGSPVHAWAAQPAGEISFQLLGKQVSGAVTPYVYLMKIDRALISQKMRGLSNMTSVTPKTQQGTNTNDSDLTNAVSKIEEIRSDISAENSQPNSPSREARLTEVLNNFDKMYSGDTTGFLFVDTLITMFTQGAVSPTVSFTLHSAQKQLNVMYIDAELVIRDAQITKPFDQSCPSEAKVTVHMRHEVFFISYGSEGYLIRTEVPSCDGRSKAFDWVSQWLAGLKISILRPS